MVGAAVGASIALCLWFRCSTQCCCCSAISASGRPCENMKCVMSLEQGKPPEDACRMTADELLHQETQQFQRVAKPLFKACERVRSV